MKSNVVDIKTKAYEIGRNSSMVAEAVTTDVAILYANILNGEVKAKSVDDAFSIMEKNTAELYKTALTGFSDISDEVIEKSSKLFNQSRSLAGKITKIDSDDKVKEYLFRITGDQLIENQKIAYKNGRKIGYKEYVEMATRTRIQHDLLEQEQQFGKITKQLFYIADTYSDCANDHRDFQGKLYYSQQVLNSIPKKNPHYDDIMKGVNKCKMSVEAVTTGEPYLCTRPNCRHRLIPVAIDDVVTMSQNQILKDQKADKGNYSQSIIKKNYDDTQAQRRVELAIRTAKRNAEIMRKAYDKTKDPDYLKAVNRASFSIRQGQAKLRGLMEKNPTLKRDYRRENPYHLQKDLGVAYNSAPVRTKVLVPKHDIQDVVEWYKNLESPRSIKDFIKTIDFIDKQKHFEQTLTRDESTALTSYIGIGYITMNKSMYDPKGFEKYIRDYYKSYTEEMLQSRMNDIKKKVSSLHDVFKKLKEQDIHSDKSIVTYRGMEDVFNENDTTFISNGFTSSSIDPDVSKNFINSTIQKSIRHSDVKPPIRLKIIIPPNAQNQVLYGDYGEYEIIADTNSVYDIIGEEYIEHEYEHDIHKIKQLTVLMRPKPKGIDR